MSDVLQVEKREEMGSLATRRLRRSGNVPAVLYGKGQANEHLAISATQVKLVARNHIKMVQLDGAVKETALVSDMQWDPLGIEVLHLDLIRVDLKEKVQVTVSIHVHGDPAGVHEGGVLIENLHQVDISCPASSIPEQVGLAVTDLHVGQNATAGDLELPEGCELVTPADTVVAHVEAPRGDAPEVEAEAGPTEPEVISKGGEKEEE